MARSHGSGQIAQRTFLLDTLEVQDFNQEVKFTAIGVQAPPLSTGGSVQKYVTFTLELFKDMLIHHINGKR